MSGRRGRPPRSNNHEAKAPQPDSSAEIMVEDESNADVRFHYSFCFMMIFSF